MRNWRIDWRWIAVFSAIAAAIYKANDVYITHNFFNDKDNATVVAFTYLIIGGWVGLICNFFYSIIFGKKIDQRFRKITWGSNRTQVFAFISGLFGAITTFFMLLGSSKYDPSVVIPLSSLTIVFLVFYDVSKKQITLEEILKPMIIIILGTIVISLYGLDQSIVKISFEAIALLFVFKGVFDAVGNIFSKIGVGLREDSKSSDAVNFAFWRFLWLTVTGTILSVVALNLMGKFSLFLDLLTKQIGVAIYFIAITMFFVFFSNTLQMYAYSLREGAVSKVTMLLNVQLILGVPLTLVVALFDPIAFGNLPSNLVSWVFKILGSVLIFWGVYLLAKKKDVVKTVSERK